MEITGIYDLRLVFLSFLVAVMASYTALNLAGRVTASTGRSRTIWLVAGAVAMGLGIWSMHFVAMLVFRLPMPMPYHVPTVLLSLLVALAASGLALFIVSRRTLGLPQLLLAGALMGLAIASMHYIGMAGMRMQASIHYDRTLYALSILIAIGASLAALWIAFQLRRGGGTKRHLLTTGASLVMGTAISGMHYTGMAAAHFVSVDRAPIHTSLNPGTPGLGAIAIAAGTFIVLGSALLTALVDRRMVAHTKEAQALRQSEERLRAEVAERRRAEERLRESEERFRILFEHSPDGVLLMDPHDPEVPWRIIECNDTACRMNGYSREDLIGQSVSVLHSEIVERRTLDEHLERLRISPDKVELEHRRKDGMLLFVEAVSSLIRVGGQEMVLGIERDITDRRRTEELLLESEARFRALYEHSPDGVLVFDPHDPDVLWPILDCNEAAARMNGYTREELIGQSLNLLLERQEDSEFFARYIEDLRGGTVHAVDVHRRKDGSTLPIDYSSSIVYVGGRELVLGIDRDITLRARAEKHSAAFSALGQRLSMTSSPASAARIIAEVSDELLGWDAFALLMYSSKDDLLRQVLNYDLIDGRRVELPDDGVATPVSPRSRRVMAGESLLLLPEAPSVGLLDLRPFGDVSRPSASLMFVPLRTGQDTIGVLTIQSYTPLAYTDTDLQTLQSLADHCGGALERIRAGEALSALASIVESSGDAIMSMALDGTLSSWNAAAERLYGYTANEVLGKSISILVSADRAHELPEKLGQVLRGEQIRYFETIRMAKDGRQVPVSISISPIRDASGRITGVSSIHRDISERIEAEEALKRRDAILHAVSLVARRFLESTGAWQESVQETLSTLGSATTAERAYLFENHVVENGQLLTSQRYEWVAPGVASRIERPDLQGLSLQEAGLARWHEVLSAGGVIHGLVRDLPSGERGVLEAEQIRSIAVVPIFVGEEWWGCIGFDEWSRERKWSEAEVEALRAAASTVGSAIARQRMERALRESEERFRTVVDQSSLSMEIFALDGRCVRANAAWQRLWNADVEDALRYNILEDKQVMESPLGEYIRRGFAGEVVRAPRTYYEPAKSGHAGRGRWVEMHIYPVRDAEGRAQQVVLVREDVTARVEVEEGLRRSEASLAQAQRIAHVGSWEWDLSTNDVYWSDEAYRLFGVDPEEFVPTYEAVIGCIHAEDRAQVDEMVRTAARDRTAYSGEFRVVRSNGETHVIEAQGEIELGCDGTPVRMLGTILDITERKASEEQLRHQAFHDSLTGLPNRALLLDRLDHALVRATRRGDCVAVLYVDLDRFKFVNDSLGHDAGDRVLVETSRRLRACLRPEDTAARLGGDEFAVLLEDVSSLDEGTRVAERIEEALGKTLEVGGREVVVTCSVGIAVGQGDAAGLLRDADIAMYRAKQGGKARHEIYDSGMGEQTRERLELEIDLRRALERDDLVLHYQPKVELATGRVVGMEALVRWVHPTRGLMPPEEFIALAEETGLILPIGRWILGEACRQTQMWSEECSLDREFDVSVNVSARQFGHPELVSEVAEALEKTGLAARALTLEITESALMDDAQANTVTLNELTALGVRLAADDFGTGYSSLSYLRRFPVDFLKIDRSFVDGLGRESDDTAIVRSVISLAHSLRLEVIAEGVETADQWDRLRALGCRYGQGFHFSRPLTAQAMGTLLRRRPPSRRGRGPRAAR